MAKKLNNTENRKIILEIFQNSNKPLIVEEIVKEMFEKTGKKMILSTVYRNLKKHGRCWNSEKNI